MTSSEHAETEARLTELAAQVDDIQEELEKMQSVISHQGRKVTTIGKEIVGTSERIGLRTQVRILWKTHTAGWTLIGAIVGFILRGWAGL